MEILNKKCPYCKSDIPADAVKCKHCGEFLGDEYASEYVSGSAPRKSSAAPQNYLVWAILSTVFCCLPFGIVSIVFAARVDSAWLRGDYQEAERSSRQARGWMLASVFTGVGVTLIYFALIMLGVLAGGFWDYFG